MSDATTTFEYNAETGEAKWFSPTDGRGLLTLNGLTFRQAHEITRAIETECKVSARVARMLLCDDVEGYLRRKGNES